MTLRFAYFYVMGPDRDRVRVHAPAHADYWRSLALQDYLGGPFADLSGGLITFRTDDAGHAEEMVAADPFLTEALLESHTLKEWAVR